MCSGAVRNMTDRDCCVENPEGRSFSVDQECFNCIGTHICVTLSGAHIMIVTIISSVFGWFADSFIEVESEDDYTIQVGYQKRPQSLATSLSFDIIVIDQNSAG